MQIRVLITEPDPPLLETYERFLSREGFELFTATDGPECVSAIQQQAPDVLLLEPDLPDGWGSRLLQMMDAEQIPSIPTVVLSRRDEPLASRSICESFHKPTSLSLVVGKIREIAANNGG